MTQVIRQKNSSTTNFSTKWNLWVKKPFSLVKRFIAGIQLNSAREKHGWWAETVRMQQRKYELRHTNVEYFRMHGSSLDPSQVLCWSPEHQDTWHVFNPRQVQVSPRRFGRFSNKQKQNTVSNLNWFVSMDPEIMQDDGHIEESSNSLFTPDHCGRDPSWNHTHGDVTNARHSTWRSDGVRSVY